MIITLIIMMTVLSLLGGGVYIAYSASNTMDVQHQLNQNETRAESARDFIIKNTALNQGNFLVPVGDGTADYQRLPESLGHLRFAANGTAMAYCPFGDDNDTTNPVDIQLPGDTNTYLAGSAVIGDNTYITGSEIDSGDWVAAIITPLPQKNAVPSCDSITFSENNVVVANGRAWGINKTDILSDKVISATSERAFTVSPTGTGDNSLEHILESFQQGVYSTGIVRVMMEEGTYSIDPALLDLTSTGGEKKLVMQGIGATASIIEAADASVITADLAQNDLSIINVEINADIIASGGDVLIKNGGVNALTSNQGQVFLNNATLYHSNTALAVSGGSVSFLNGLQSNGGILLSAGATGSTKDANITINSTSKGNIKVESGASFSASGGVISITNSSFAPHVLINEFGEMIFRGTTLNATGSYDAAFFNKGIMSFILADVGLNGSANYGTYNLSGSVLKIEASEYFSPAASTDIPAVGVQDVGTMSLAAGGNSNISGTTCWAGDMFSETDGVSSANTLDNFQNTGNKSTWTCQ